MLATSSQESLTAYCEALGWDPVRLKSALYPAGPMSLETYVIEPNEQAIETILDFIFLSGAAGICTIQGETGSGKSILKAAITRQFAGTPTIKIIGIDDPGRATTPLRLAGMIHQALDPEAPVSRGATATIRRLTEALAEETARGCTPVIWIDEGQKLTASHLTMIRGLSDATTTTGVPVCKVIVAGTVGLDAMLEQGACEPGERAALVGRCGLYTIALVPWEDTYVNAWIKGLCEVAKSPTSSGPAQNPFTVDAVKFIHAASGGKARSVVQLVELAIHARAKQFAHNPSGSTQISGAYVKAVVQGRCAE
jgi:type II secretory pathway predicted ATPase ExeA